MIRPTTLAPKLCASVCFAVLATTRSVLADPPPPVDVVIHDAPPPKRTLTIEWNPVALATIGKLSANLVVAPVDHHAVVISPFYASVSTAPITLYDEAGNPTNLPSQSFRGFGGELGYRYYFGTGGPRGFFLGPSLLLSYVTATAANGSQTNFADFGVAADAGYEVLVVDRVVLCLGAGLQYTGPSRSIPDQQLPAKIYANDALLPRLLLSIGWAL